MDSDPVIQKLYSLICLIEILPKDAVCCKADCQHVAASVCLLKAPLTELQQLQTPWNADMLSIFSKLESTLLKMKELLKSCNGLGSKSILTLENQPLFKKLASKFQALLKTLTLDSLPVSEKCKELVQECISSLESGEFVTNFDGSDIDFVDEIDHALTEIKKGTKLSRGVLLYLRDKLGLKSNQEILIEASVLEKEKNLAQINRNKNEEELLNLLIALVTQMSDDLAEQKTLEAQEGGILIPADFRCPLSLEPMSDPVIVASGQTYERAHIQKWLEQGNTTCPKSRQTLNHFTLIPNVTVKGLISSWYEQNGVSLPEPTNTPMLAHNLARGQMSNGIGRSIETAAPMPNVDIAVTSPLSTETGHIISREEGESASSQDAGLGVSWAESRIIFHGQNREYFLGRSDRECLHSVEGECSRDGLVSSRQHSSTSIDSSSSNYSPTELDAKRSISLPTRLRGDASGNLVSLAVSSPSILPHGEDYGACAHPGDYETGRQIVSAGSSPCGTSQSNLGMESDGDNIQFRVQGLVRDLQSTQCEVQKNAATELRLLAKFNPENRIIIADSGAIPPLVSLLHSTDSQIQENAVTALLNLSINDNNKSEIASANAIGPLVHVLNIGSSEARENAAATLFSLSVMAENKITIGQSGAIDSLVDLLTNGKPRGKKDAATALYNLSICQENKFRIVQANAVKPLVKLMSDPAAGMVDKAVAVLANLATIQEGRLSIGEEGGIPILVDVVETGPQRGREHAAAALYQLCTNHPRFKSKVLQAGVIPPLVSLSQLGTPRAKEKASALLRLFKEQRRGPGAGTQDHSR